MIDTKVLKCDADTRVIQFVDLCVRVYASNSKQSN